MLLAGATDTFQIIGLEFEEYNDNDERTYLLMENIKIAVHGHCEKKDEDYESEA